jgi:hypothetical protein
MNKTKIIGYYIIGKRTADDACYNDLYWIVVNPEEQNKE